MRKFTLLFIIALFFISTLKASEMFNKSEYTDSELFWMPNHPIFYPGINDEFNDFGTYDPIFGIYAPIYCPMVSSPEIGGKLEEDLLIPPPKVLGNSSDKCNKRRYKDNDSNFSPRKRRKIQKRVKKEDIIAILKTLKTALLEKSDLDIIKSNIFIDFNDRFTSRTLKKYINSSIWILNNPEGYAKAKKYLEDFKNKTDKSTRKKRKTVKERLNIGSYEITDGLISIINKNISID